MFGSSIQGNLGVNEDPTHARCVAKGYSPSAGQAGQLDLARSSAANALIGDPDSALATVITPTTAGQEGYSVVGVWLESVQVNLRGKFKICGLVNAYIHKTSGDVSAGDPLVVKDGQTYLSADPSAGDRIVAVYQPEDGSALTAPSTAVLGRVAIQGINGLTVRTS